MLGLDSLFPASDVGALGLDVNGIKRWSGGIIAGSFTPGGSGIVSNLATNRGENTL